MLFARSDRKMLPSEVREKKTELMQHVHDMKRERKVAMELHRESVGRSNWNFQYDDKCGSQFLHLPCARGGRTAKAWQYRIGLQANLFVGALNRMSIVPPCLKTGANFALTSFLSAALRLHELGLLGEVIIRQASLSTHAHAHPLFPCMYSYIYMLTYSCMCSRRLTVALTTSQRIRTRLIGASYTLESSTSSFGCGSSRITRTTSRTGQTLWSRRS